MVDHPERGPIAFTLQPRYTIPEMARELNMTRARVRTMLADCGVYPRPGRNGRMYVWISDISACAPQFLDSWTEVRHQRDLAALREETGGLDETG